MWGNLHSIYMGTSKGLKNELIWVGEAQKGRHFKAVPKSGFVQESSAAVGPPSCSMNQLSALSRVFL